MSRILLSLFLLNSTFGITQYADRLIDLFGPELKPGVACYRIPALITAQDGTLIAIADERMGSCKDLGGNDDINLVMRRSRNKGKTWTAAETVIDYPKGQSASDAALLSDEQTSTVFLLFNYMDHVNRKGRYRFHLMRSTNAGITWSSPEDITDQIIRPEWQDDFQFITSGSGIQTRSGWLLHTLVNVSRQSGWVFGSVDHGKTWRLFPGELKPADESKIIELPDGKWMVNARVNKIGHRYIHMSEDNGQTWKSAADQNLEDPGCNASILVSGRKGDTKMMFTNLNNPRERQKLSLRISTDSGRNWASPQTIYPGSAAYSCLSPLSGGQAALIFERDDYSRISFLRLRRKDLEDFGAPEAGLIRGR